MDSLGQIDREAHREYATALDVFRICKNAFFWLTLAAVAFHLTAWMLVRSNDTPSAVVPTENNVTDTATGETSPSPWTQTGSRRWTSRLESPLSIAGFIGRSALLVMTGINIIALLISLSARLGGAAGLSKACVLSLAALALVTPWVHVDLSPSFGSTGLFYGTDELSRPAATSTLETFLSILRFGLCPILVAILAVLSELNFRSAYRKMTEGTTAKLSIHEV